MKILFLDIDGVLNSDSWYTRRREDGLRMEDMGDRYPFYEFDPESVARLNKIIDATDCNIVVSSTWRHNKQLNDILKEVGVKKTPIDITPYSTSGIRGMEIQAWINEHAEDPFYYVILDDNSDMLKTQKPHFCKISWWTGILESDVEKAIKILNHEADKQESSSIL